MTETNMRPTTFAAISEQESFSPTVVASLRESHRTGGSSRMVIKVSDDFVVRGA